MEDVARAAGVSKATVSRVLAGIETGCTPATAQLVRDSANRLGYIVNSVAASLRSRQSYTIGLILADVSNPFFGAVASGVEQRLSETGYSLILANSDNSLEAEKALVRVLTEKRVDGLIAAPSAAIGDHLLDVAQRGIKVVLVDSEIPNTDLDCISIDNRKAAQVAITHLLELGHRRIAIVTGPLDAVFDRQRFEGYRETLAKAGVAFDEQLVLRADLTTAGGERAVEKFLALKPRPTALFTSNNMMTLGVLIGLNKSGLRIPDDLSLVGFDDQPWYEVCQPPLTAVSNPAYDMGVTAAGRLLGSMGRRGFRPLPPVLLDCSLVVRKSTASPRRRQ
jgi:LacI family transcriptional regulator